VGLGVYIGEGKIVTCAHVVQQAIGEAVIAGRPVDDVPHDYIPVIFPHSADSRIHRVQVLDGGWFPKQAEAGDLAVLQLVDQDTIQATPAPLRLVGPLANRMSERPVIEVLGYPPPYSSGTWSRARLVGRAGPRLEWIQLDAPTLTGKRIRAGYSGAGVIDEDDGRVIGCVVAEDTAAEDRTAWMIPTDVISRYWRPLEPMCQPAPPGVPPRRPDRSLRQDEKLDRLARLLHAHSAFFSPADRLLYAAALQSLFAGRLYLANSDVDSDDFNSTSAIVYACSAHPGALDSLGKYLGKFQRAEDEGIFAAIKAAIEALDPAPLLEPSERNDLYRHLDMVDPQVRADMVIRSYWEAVPQLSHPEIDWLRLPSVVRALEAMPAMGDLPPLVHFLEILCRQLPEDITTDLHRWVDALARRDNLDREQIERLRFSSELWSSPVTRGYLLTEITPDGADSNLYLPRISLQHAAQSGRVVHGVLLYPPEGRTVEPVPWEDIPQLFDAAISQIWTDPLGSIRRNLVVEFTLPVPLLSEPVDQWEIERSATAHVVGIDYIVVIRIWDRTTNSSLLNRSITQWETKSVRLGVDQAAILWIDPEDEQHVTTRLYGQLSPDRPVLGMLRPPPLPGVPANDAISIAIRTGVPVLLWRRDEPISESLVSRVDQYVSRHGFLGLPGYILELRQEAANINPGNASATERANMGEGANLTLVWDLADRFALASRRTGSSG